MKYSSTERKLHATQPNMHIYVLIFRGFSQILKYIRNFNIVILRRVVAGSHKYGTNTPGVNLATLLGCFQAQRMMEVDSVLSASDQELVRLGVSTIGDRILLRETCRKKGARRHCFNQPIECFDDEPSDCCSRGMSINFSCTAT